MSLLNSFGLNLLIFVLAYSSFVCSISHFGEFLNEVPSVFPERISYPGLHSPRKAWWAKELTPDFHVCGRLSERQIKYAYEAGFKSIISLFTYPPEDQGYFGDEYLPVTLEEKEIVENTGLQFFALLDPMDEWSSVEAVRKFTAISDQIKKPALLHCDRGYTITFVTLLYMANQTRFNPNFQPKIHSKEFFEMTASMGLDFFSRIPLEIIAEITGEPVVQLEDNNLPRVKYQPQEWLDYWLAHPVHSNWFVAGQILKSHIPLLKEFEYKNVINLRCGLQHKGTPSQEEVNLLNIRSYTGTYGEKDTLPRQMDKRLRETRLNPDLSNSYISDTADVNYEKQNSEEFGDEMGYNSEFQRVAFLNSGVNYYHLPYLYDGNTRFCAYY